MASRSSGVRRWIGLAMNDDKQKTLNVLNDIVDSGWGLLTGYYQWFCIFENFTDLYIFCSVSIESWYQ